MLGVVEGDAENLADLTGRHGEGLRRRALAALRPERGQIDDPRRGAAEVDADIIERVGAGRRLDGGDAGEAGDDGVAGLDDRLLGARRGDGKGAGQRQGREADQPFEAAVGE